MLNNCLKGILGKLVLVVFIQLIGVTIVFAQDHSVSGTVTDGNTGEPLPGVNIQVKETTTGTSTNAQGKYELTVESLQDTLVFSFVGYKKKVVPISRRSSIDVILKTSAMQLGNMVVTAFGLEQEKRSLSYSTQEVDIEQLNKNSNPNLMVSLEGKVPGLSISQAGSGLGAPARVTLRGNRSIDGNNEPLYVVDGVPTRGQPETLSSENIASINVLKGANAAALYGSGAQNGAIVIETKTAKKNENSISLNNKFTFNNPIIRYRYQNVYGQGNSGLYSAGARESWGPKMEGQMVKHWSLDPEDAGMQYALLPQPNNIRDFFQTGYNLSNNINIGLGGEKIQAMISFTNTRAADIIPHHKLQRYNASIRINSQIKKWISFDGKIGYINQARNGNSETGGFSSGAGKPFQSEIHSIYQIPRSIRTQDMKNYDFYDEQGALKQNYWQPGSGRAMNPYWVLNRILLPSTYDRIMAMGSVTLDFTDALSLLLRVSYDGDNERSERKVYNDTFVHGDLGNYIINESQDYELDGDFLLSYKQDFTKDWNINANLGGSFKKNRDLSLHSAAGDAQGVPGLVIPNMFSISNSLNAVTSNDFGSPVNKNSLYAFANINWKDAIYLNFSGRNDWSSTLPAESRSYFYPSAGVSVVLSDLIPTFPDIFNFAKASFTWSKVGNDAPYGMLNRAVQFTPGGRNGFLSISSTRPNTHLLPEETESYEASLDLEFLEDRLGLGITAYKANTKNQLFPISVPIGSGESQYFTNGGNIQNKGLEAYLTTTPVQTRNLEWDFNVNFSRNRNKVISLSEQRSSLIIGSLPSYNKKLIPGEDYGNIYVIGYKRDNQGRVVVGSNGVPQFTDGRSVLAGHYQPDWTGGISSTFEYRGISLHFLINHRQGGIVFSEAAAMLAGFGDTKRTLQGREGGLIFGDNFFPKETAVKQDGSPNNIQMDAETFWTSVGGDLYTVGEPFIEDGTNMQLKELSIGYLLPSSILGKMGLSTISNLRISLVGRNLFYIYKASFVDPDIRVNTGQEKGGYGGFLRPTIRSFGANLSIKF